MSDSSLKKAMLLIVIEIEKQVDNIDATSIAQIHLLNRCFGPTGDNKYFYCLDSEIRGEEDFFNTAYILDGLISLNKGYCEKIDLYTKKICEIFEGKVDQDIIDKIYNDIAGDFFTNDPETQRSLYSYTTQICNTSRQQLKEIFKDPSFGPNGTQYLNMLLQALTEYRNAIKTIPDWIEYNRNSVIPFL